jgi:hypothetical protein
MKGYMTTKEAANKWGITQRQVQNHCKSGRIAGLQQAGRSWLIPEETMKPKYMFVCEVIFEEKHLQNPLTK